MTNASNVIFPDKDNGVWVDDPNDGLPREPFVTIEPGRPIVRTLPADSSLLSPPGHFLAMDTVGRLREDGGGNWYRSEQSCFVIARDLRSLAPSRASTCKTSWIDGSLF